MASLRSYTSMESIDTFDSQSTLNGHDQDLVKSYSVSNSHIKNINRSLDNLDTSTFDEASRIQEILTDDNYGETGNLDGPYNFREGVSGQITTRLTEGDLQELLPGGLPMPVMAKVIQTERETITKNYHTKIIKSTTTIDKDGKEVVTEETTEEKHEADTQTNVKNNTQDIDLRSKSFVRPSLGLNHSDEHQQSQNPFFQTSTGPIPEISVEKGRSEGVKTTSTMNNYSECYSDQDSNFGAEQMLDVKAQDRSDQVFKVEPSPALPPRQPPKKGNVGPKSPRQPRDPSPKSLTASMSSPMIARNQRFAQKGGRNPNRPFTTGGSGAASKGPKPKSVATSSLTSLSSMQSQSLTNVSQSDTLYNDRSRQMARGLHVAGSHGHLEHITSKNTSTSATPKEVRKLAQIQQKQNLNNQPKPRPVMQTVKSGSVKNLSAKEETVDRTSIFDCMRKNHSSSNLRAQQSSRVEVDRSAQVSQGPKRDNKLESVKQSPPQPRSPPAKKASPPQTHRQPSAPNSKMAPTLKSNQKASLSPQKQFHSPERKERRLSSTSLTSKSEQRDVLKINKSINTTIMARTSSINDVGQEVQTKMTSEEEGRRVAAIKSTKVFGSGVSNAVPSTRQLNPNLCLWHVKTNDLFVESIEYKPRAYKTVYDKKFSLFHLLKLSKSTITGEAKTNHPRDPLPWSKEHSRTVVKKRVMKPTKFVNEVKRQYPRESIKDTIEKGCNWLNKYKNVLTLELVNPRTNNMSCIGSMTFRQEVMVPAAV